jgi:hypothetical protein
MDSGARDDYATWDAPYVLGALDRAERLEFEAHLAGCAQCRAAVADLAGLPGLLGLVDGKVAMALVDPPEPIVALSDSWPGTQPEPTQVIQPPATLPTRPAELSRRRALRGRLIAVGAAVAAAAAAVAIAVPVTASVTGHSTPSTTQQVVAERAMDHVRPSPITASFRLFTTPNGTRVELSCSLAPSNTNRTWAGTLWVVRSDGTQSLIAEWTAYPGQTLTADGVTTAAPNQIRSVEIHSATTGQVVLSGSL